MTKKNFLRWFTVAALSLVSLIFGAKTIFAEINPTLELTNSVNNWTVTQGTSLTLNVRVLPDYYHTLSRIEIRQGNSVLNTCANQNNCSYTLASVAYGTTFYQAVGYDVDGRIYSSQVMNLVAVGNYGSTYGNTSFSLTSSATEVDATNSGMYIETRIADNAVIKDVRIFRVEDWKLEAVNTCSNEPYNCTVRFYPTYSSSDAGKTFTYEAQSTDVNNAWVASNRITIRVRPLASNNTLPTYINGTYVYGNQLPGVYLDRGTIPEQINADRTVSIRANAWDNEGLSSLAIYAYPQNSAIYSSQPHFEKMCGTTLYSLNCVLDISDFRGYEGVTFNVWAVTTDKAGQQAVSTSYTLRISNTYTPPINSVQNISLTSIPTEITSGQSLSVTATASDNDGLKTIVIYAVPQAHGYIYGSNINIFTQSCNVSGTYATCTLSRNNLYGYEGSYLTLYAVAYDQYSNQISTNQYTLKVTGYVAPAPAPVPLPSNPTVSVSTIYADTDVREDRSFNVYGRAAHQSGLWGIEIRALPSWSNDVISKRCVFGNNGTTKGNCTMPVGPFKGHAGQTVKVWTIAWAAENGVGTSSDAKTLTITALPKPNYAPQLSVSTLQKTLTSNQTVTVRAEASDLDGIDHIDLYVNARVVKTCSATNCEYVGGPFPKYTGSGISYAAKVWDKTGKSTWSGYKGIRVTR